MPDYHTHKKVSLYLLSPVAFLTTWIVAGGHLRLDAITGKELLGAAMVALGSYAGNTFLSPDLDIPSTPYNSWRLGRLLWLPYQVTTSHRSPMSHWPIMGAVFQHLYLMAALIFLGMALVGLWNYVLVPFTDLGPRYYGGQSVDVSAVDIFLVVTTPLRHALYWLFLLGHTIGAMAHCIMDFADSRRRRHYGGQPVGPSSKDERQAARGRAWER